MKIKDNLYNTLTINLFTVLLQLTCTEKSASTGLDTLMSTSSPTTFTRSVIDLAGLKAVSRGLALDTLPARPCAVGVLRDRAKNRS